MTNGLPSIEACFLVYLRNLPEKHIDPLAEDEQRRSFYCGFESAMIAFDGLAEEYEKDQDEGEEAYNRYRAEFDKFATENVCGKKSTNH